MAKAKVRERREDARQAQKKALEKAGVKLKDNLVFPEYWAKRKYLLNAGLLKELQETADREPVVTDEFGSYKPGTFLFKACIVTVTVEDGLWMIHIFSQAMPITGVPGKAVTSAETGRRLQGERSDRADPAGYVSIRVFCLHETGSYGRSREACKTG